MGKMSLILTLARKKYKILKDSASAQIPSMIHSRAMTAYLHFFSSITKSDQNLPSSTHRKLYIQFLGKFSVYETVYPVRIHNATGLTFILSTS